MESIISLLYGLPSSSLKKLQKVQNMAAKILTLRRKYEHITPILQELHWLPVEHRITYKILLTIHCVLNGKVPQYITDLLTSYIPERNLWSEGEGYLVVLKLPKKLRENNTLSQFKSYIKSYLFTTDFC